MADNDVIALPLDLVLHDRGGGFMAAVESSVTPPSSATSPAATSGSSDTGIETGSDVSSSSCGGATYRVKREPPDNAAAYRAPCELGRQVSQPDFRSVNTSTSCHRWTRATALCCRQR